MKFLVSLAIALFSVVSLANISAEQEQLLNKSLGAAGEKVQLGTLLNKTSNLLVAKYSYAVQGGSSTSSLSLLTDLNDRKSLAKLPNKAIIKNVWVDVLTQPTSLGSATVSVKAVSTGDLVAATAKASLTGRVQGVPNDTVTNAIKLSAEKTVKADVGVAILTAGKFNVYIEYVVGD